MAEKPELQLVSETEEKTYKPRVVGPASRRRKIILASIIVLFVVLVAIAFVAGYFARRVASNCKISEAEESEDIRANHEDAISGISAALIEKHLR